jgi:hypothetical protein
MQRLGGLLIVLSLAACNTMPERVVVPKAELVTVTRIVYVPIPAALTTPLTVAEGPLAQCPSIARERRATIETCNARLAEISAIQGTEPKPNE